MAGASSTARARPFGFAVARVGGRAPILFDGGIRSGSTCCAPWRSGPVFRRRAWAFALAGAGERGVAHVIDLVRRELSTAMALTGLADVRKASADLIDKD